MQLGITDDTYTVNADGLSTWRSFVKSYLNNATSFSHHPLLDEMKNYLENKKSKSSVIKNLEWLGIFGNEKLPLSNATPAKLLQHLLEQKWKMESTDKDMVVMHHQFIFQKNKQRKKVFSTLVLKGENQIHTAMAKTVGLPLAIGAVLMLKGKIKQHGVLIPTNESIYQPVLQELEKMGIVFKEEIM